MKYYKYSMNMKKLNIYSILIFILVYILILFLNIIEYIDFTCLILYFFWMFFHEFLHGVGFSFSDGVNHRNIVYGACLEKGIFYCMCKQRISKKNIMISLMFPFFFIGIFTFFIGSVFNIPLLVLLSLFNIAGCVGDLAMFFSFIKLPNFSYVDLDDCTGFVLISDYDLSCYKLFAMDFIESGDYDSSMVANDYRKFNVSKLSFVIFLLLFFLFVLSLCF